MLVLLQELVKGLKRAVLELFDELLPLLIGLRRRLELGQLALHGFLLLRVIVGQETLELPLQLRLFVEGREHLLDKGVRVDL